MSPLWIVLPRSSGTSPDPEMLKLLSTQRTSSCSTASRQWVSRQRGLDRRFFAATFARDDQSENQLLRMGGLQSGQGEASAPSTLNLGVARSSFMRDSSDP